MTTTEQLHVLSCECGYTTAPQKYESSANQMMARHRASRRYAQALALVTGPTTLILHDWDDTSRRRVAILTLSGEGDHYVLEGSWEGAPLRLVLVRHPTGDSLLVNRGFRFINEVPFNR